RADCPLANKGEVPRAPHAATCGSEERAEMKRSWIGISSSTVAAVVLLADLFIRTGSALAAGSVVQTFFSPLPEPQVRTSLLNLYTSTGSVIDAVTSIVVTGNGTRIYFDHWEDGYEVDIENPTQTTSRIWGDGNTLNGVAPGHPSDLLDAGDVVALRNLV